MNPSELEHTISGHSVIVATNHQVSANLADEVVMLVAPGGVPSWGDQVGIVAAPIWVLAASPGKNDTSDQPGLNR